MTHRLHFVPYLLFPIDIRHLLLRFTNLIVPF
jgi:hypothetical protein